MIENFSWIPKVKRCKSRAGAVYVTSLSILFHTLEERREVMDLIQHYDQGDCNIEEFSRALLCVFDTDEKRIVIREIRSNVHVGSSVLSGRSVGVSNDSTPFSYRHCLWSSRFGIWPPLTASQRKQNWEPFDTIR